MLKPHKGFTTLEVLLVLATVAILVGIVILGINPSQLLADSRNEQRTVDVNTILNAITQYRDDHNGILPANIPEGACLDTIGAEICQTGIGSCQKLVDFEALTKNERYLVMLPIDPNGKTLFGTGYRVTKNDHERITVCAPAAERSAVISITR